MHLCPANFGPKAETNELWHTAALQYMQVYDSQYMQVYDSNANDAGKSLPAYNELGRYKAIMLALTALSWVAAPCTSAPDNLCCQL